jgi:hypothetical protein
VGDGAEVVEDDEETPDVGVNDGFLSRGANTESELISSVESPEAVASVFAALAAPIPSAGSGTLPPFDSGPGVDPERELPVLVRDDDIDPLSTTEFAASTSGSASRTADDIMNELCVVDASSTPSSSLPTSAPLHLS